MTISGDVVFDNVLVGHALGEMVSFSIMFAKLSRGFMKGSLVQRVQEFEKTGDTTLDFRYMKFRGAADDPGLAYDLIMGLESWRSLVASSRHVMDTTVGTFVLRCSICPENLAEEKGP